MRASLIVALVLAVWVGSDAFYIVDETELAIVTRFGQFRAMVLEPGLNLKAPTLDQVRRMDRRILGSDTTPTEYLTLDKKRLVADPITRWRIVDPLRFFKTVHDENGADKRLDDIVQSELRREIASVNFGDIIGNAREPLMQKVRERVRTKTREFGIETIDVRIKRADLPDQVQESVFARMRAERDRVAKQYRSEGEEEAAKIRADTDKERTILLAKAYETSQKLRGEGDAESARIYAETYGADEDFYVFTRTLETYERAITKDSQLVLSTDSEFLRYLRRARQ